MHFLFLELGGVLCFDLVLKSMARAGVQSLSSWEQSDSNQLTVASNAAARYFKRYIVCGSVQLCIGGDWIYM